MLQKEISPPIQKSEVHFRLNVFYHIIYAAALIMGFIAFRLWWWARNE